MGAKVDQKVVVHSDTKKMLRIVTLVYFLPVVLFLAGYLVPALMGAGVALQYGLAGLGFFAGIAGAIGYDRYLRRRGGLSFTIVRLF